MTLVQFIDAPIFWHLLTLTVLAAAMTITHRSETHEKESTK